MSVPVVTTAPSAGLASALCRASTEKTFPKCVMPYRLYRMVFKQRMGSCMEVVVQARACSISSATRLPAAVWLGHSEET